MPIPLTLELGSIHDPATRRAFEQITTQLYGVTIAAGGGGGAPSGPAGGDLAGTYPNPGIASGVIVDGDINAAAGIAKSKLAALAIVNADVDAAAAIAESKLNLATDAAAGTGSRRTLGTGATQAAAGNDARFTDARTPTAHATSHQPGGSDAMAVDAAAATGSLRTLGTGAAQALPGNHVSTTNARTPTAHATTHQPGGSDAMAVDAAAATGSLRTLGTGATQAAAGNDSRFTDARTPTAHKTSHETGGSDALTGNLDANGRVNVKKAGASVGIRRGLNLIEGANVTLTVADDAANEEVDVTIAAAGGGGGTLTTLPGTFLAYLNTTQSIPNATFTKLQFNAEDRDPNGWYDSTTNFRYTPQIAGTYQLFTAVYFIPATTNTTGIIKLYKNGAAIADLARIGTSGLQDNTYNGQFQVDANGSTDYFEIFFQQNQGTAKNVYGDATVQRFTYFGGSLLAGAATTTTPGFVSISKWGTD